MAKPRKPKSAAKSAVRMSSSPVDRVTTTPRTAGYVSIAASYQQRPRDLPPLSFDMIRSMLLDPAVRLGLAMRLAPICGIEIAYKGEAGPDGKPKWTPGVLAKRPEVAEFVRRQIARIWTHGLDDILTAQVWGWSAGEVMLRATSRGTVEVDHLLGRHSVDARALIRSGEVVGCRVLRVPSVVGGHVDLEWPKCWWHAHRPEAGAHYGQSILLGAFSPWADKCFQGGATDVRRLFMHADAYGGKDMSYPDGNTIINGQEVSNRDLAMQIAEQLQAGGVTARPAVYDAKGNELWTLKRATVPGNPEHILQYPKDLDTEIYHGLEIPDDVIESETGAWAGKRVPMAAFYNSLDLWAMSLIGDLTVQILEPLVLINFGRAEEFAATHKPLGLQAMEQQSQATPGENQPGQPGQKPPQAAPQLGGQGNGQPQPNGRPMAAQNIPQQQYRMALDAEEAVGHGVLNASELVQAARRVIRMRSGEGWLTIGGRKKGDEEHSGGFPVKIDADGKVVAGGPKGLKGKHISKVGEYFRKVRNTPSARAKRVKSKVSKRAKSWDMEPEEYQEVVDQVWKEKASEHQEREDAKAYARKRLKVTAGDVRELEEKGFDYGSNKIKGLDTLGREMASLYPGLGWGGGYGDESGRDDAEHDAELWELLKEGKQSLPAKDSDEFYADVDEYLSYLDESGKSESSLGEEWDSVAFGLRDSSSERDADA